MGNLCRLLGNIRAFDILTREERYEAVEDCFRSNQKWEETIHGRFQNN